MLAAIPGRPRIIHVGKGKCAILSEGANLPVPKQVAGSRSNSKLVCRLTTASKFRSKKSSKPSFGLHRDSGSGVFPSAGADSAHDIQRVSIAPE